MFQDSVFLSLFSILILLVGAFCITIPQSIRLYLEWKQTQKPTTFSTMVIVFALSFFLVSIAFKIGLNLGLNFTWKTMSSFRDSWLVEIVPILGVFILITLIHSIFIPKALHFYKKWISTHKPVNFSLMAFFGGLAFFCFLFIYLAILD